MNNEPVAWMEIEEGGITEYKVWREPVSSKSIPLYTHPVKELKNIVVASATCSCGKVMEVTNLQPVKELTDEEIKQVWSDVKWNGSDPIELTFARAILRKTQEADKIESLGTVNIGGVHFRNGKEE